MSILDTALKTVELIGLRDRTPYERARATYNDLTSKAEGLREFLPAMPVIPSLPSRVVTVQSTDWTGVAVGVFAGIAVGFALGMYLKESVAPTLESARKRALKAVDSLQEQLPTRLNITRIDEQEKDVKGHSPDAKGQTTL
jgi:hypothetical protein